MKLLRDCFGRNVRLTDERLAHILEHPEMIGLESAIEHALQAPSEVRRSRTDEAVRLYYALHSATPIGAKWLCTVVKHLPNDAFVITAYLTDRPKPGDPLWPPK